MPPAEQPLSATVQGRDFSLDAARASLMLLGIVLHGSTAYSRHGEWIVIDPDGSALFDVLTQAIHLFRMPAFFWISGYFFALTMSRGASARQLGRRLLRLLAPLFATWVTFNLAQDWVVARATGASPVEAIRDGVPVHHLWFLVDLTVLTLVAATSMLVPTRRLRRLGGPLHRHLTVPQLLLGLTFLSTVTILAARATGVAYVRLARVTTLARLAHYLPFFAVGIVMHHLPELRRVFLRVPSQLAIVALPLGVLAQSYRRDHGLVAELAAPTESLAIWICIAVVLQMFYQFVRHENRVVRLLNDSSYSIYLFHHAIMVALVFLLLPFPVGPLVKFFLVCILSLTTAAALHVHVVRRSDLLRLLFNGVAPRPRRAPGREPAGAPVPAPAPAMQYQVHYPHGTELASTERASGL